MSASEKHPREFSPSERQEIEAQVKRILEHPLFRQSKHLPPFLGYIVNEALNPTGDGSLKERTVGVEVFARRLDYDNNSDPVVRVTATALRKKLAQYYYEHGHEDEIRIELHPGTYVPTFCPALSKGDSEVPQSLPPQEEPAGLELAEAKEVPVAEIDNGPPLSIDNVPAGHPFRWFFAAIPICLIAIVLYFSRSAWGGDQAALEDFWKQLTNGTDHVSIIMPVIGSDDYVPSAVNPRTQSVRPVLSIEDTNIAARISGQLQRVKGRYQIVSSADVTLAELRNGPSVLIGALDNVWTMRLAKDLPFLFEELPDHRTGRIVEVDGAEHRAWNVNINLPHSNINRDYGIVASIHNRLTGQPAIIVAGVSSLGTQAAGELLTSAEFPRFARSRRTMPTSRSSSKPMPSTATLGRQGSLPRRSGSTFSQRKCAAAAPRKA